MPSSASSVKPSSVSGGSGIAGTAPLTTAFSAARACSVNCSSVSPSGKFFGLRGMLASFGRLTKVLFHKLDLRDIVMTDMAAIEFHFHSGRFHVTRQVGEDVMDRLLRHAQLEAFHMPQHQPANR